MMLVAKLCMLYHIQIKEKENDEFVVYLGFDVFTVYYCDRIGRVIL